MTKRKYTAFHGLTLFSCTTVTVPLNVIYKHLAHLTTFETILFDHNTIWKYVTLCIFFKWVLNESLIESETL